MVVAVYMLVAEAQTRTFIFCFGSFSLHAWCVKPTMKLPLWNLIAQGSK